MSEKKGRNIIPSGGGIFNNMAERIKLIFRLLGDNRVSPFLKLLPIGSALYFVIPDLALGPIDDVAVVWLGTYLFVELCPQAVVQEHMQRLERELAGNAGGPPKDGDALRDEEIIDAEYWEEGK